MLELGEKVRTPLNVHTLKELHHAVGILLPETAFLTEVMCFCVCVRVVLSFDRPPHSFYRKDDLPGPRNFPSLHSNAES